MSLSPVDATPTECACGHMQSEHYMQLDKRCGVRYYDGGGDFDDYAPCDCPGWEPMPCATCGTNGCPDCEED